MKKFLPMLFAIFVLFVGAVNAHAADLDYEGLDDTAIIVLKRPSLTFINGEEVKGIEYPLKNLTTNGPLNSTTFAPLRFFAETFGAKVFYNTETKEIEVTDGEVKLRFLVNSNFYYKNDTVYPLQSGAGELFAHEGITYAPLKILAEALGRKVYYREGIIYITRDADPIRLAEDYYLQPSLSCYAELVAADYEILLNENGLIVAKKSEEYFAVNAYEASNRYSFSLNASNASDDVAGDRYRLLTDGGERCFQLGMSYSGAITAWRDHFVQLSADGRFIYLAEADALVYDVKFYEGCLYYIQSVKDWNPVFYEDDLYIREGYEGNLFRLSLAGDAMRQGDEVIPQPIGREGFHYGVKPIVGPWREGGSISHPENIVWLNDQRQDGQPLLDWEIRENGIYAIGVDLSETKAADKTLGYYLIPFAERDHQFVDGI